MEDFEQPESSRSKRSKAAHIEDESPTFRWLIPAALIVLSVVLVVLIAVSIAVIFDVVPLG